MPMLVLRLDDALSQSVAATGGKAASLSRLAAHHPVPPGFCVTAEAYRRWTESATSSAMPGDVHVSVSSAYEALALQCAMRSPRVAVRSSGVVEDGHTSSFAGQYATYLNVSGIGEVEDAIMRCWASEGTERVRAYRHRQADGGAEAPVAVLVQQLILADVSFVAFSANPVSADPTQIVINSNWGLGETIVDGEVVPDTYVVRKSDRALIDKVVAEKERMTVVCAEGVRSMNVPRALRGRDTLSMADVSAITAMTMQLEAELGWPVDVEGALHDGNVYLLQCRPITTR
jgi:pyruvate,water dikinase